jgi:hypothetical protein
MKSFLIWFIAFLLTLGTAAFQRMTGPSYPVTGKINIGNDKVAYKLPTSYAGNDDAAILIFAPERFVAGKITYKRMLSNDTLTTLPLKRAGNYLVTFIPHQPPAGKVSYRISLIAKTAAGESISELTKKDVIIRFRGDIPAMILVPHIIIIFLAMLFSTVTGIEAIFGRKKVLVHTWLTVISLLIGGLIFGPIVQKYSFGAYWTGWPFGHDMTDNKSLVAFLFWIAALFIQYRKKENRTWPIVAAIVMLVVFLIPHSILGSERDYTKASTTEIHGN